MASYTRVDAVRDRVAELDMLRCSFTGPDHVHMGTSEADEAGLRSWSDVRDSADDDAAPLPPLEYDVSLTDCGLLCTIAYDNSVTSWCSVPRVAVRGLGKSLSQPAQLAMTRDLAALTADLPPADPCAWPILTWLGERGVGVDGGSSGGGGGGSSSSGSSASAPTTPSAAPAASALVRGSGELCERQWLMFIGFYTRSIIEDFCTTADGMGLTGFLMSGKPAVSCLEGPKAVVQEFLRVVRVELFATVPAASRKMQVALAEPGVATRLFAGFKEVSFPGVAGVGKGGASRALNDLGALRTYLQGLHVPAEVFEALFAHVL